VSWPVPAVVRRFEEHRLPELVVPAGMAGAVGAMHVFRGAGIVMCCPNCDNAVAKIVKDGTRMWMNFGGMQALEITL